MPVCELCGKSDFVKQDGMFVCQGCGTKYTLEEARKLSDASGDAAQTAASTQGAGLTPSAVIGEIAVAALAALAGALQEQAAPQAQDVRSLNNLIVQGWQSVVDEYGKIEHPIREDLNRVVGQAKECLIALDNAAMAEPDKYVQNTILYDNCVELVSSVEDLDCYEQVDGEWKRVSFPVSSSDLKIPGQSESWKDKRAAHEAHIREEYIGSHPEDEQRRAELQSQEAEIQQELDVLKDEKRSKGFFNFAEKREVKERMAPVKARLSDVRNQMRALDDNVDTYVEERLDELGKSFARLDF